MPLSVQAFLAVLPILVAAVLLVGFRVPARVAMPVADQARHKIITAGALDRLFSGRKNLGDGDDIGIVETRAEVVEMMT